MDGWMDEDYYILAFLMTAALNNAFLFDISVLM